MNIENVKSNICLYERNKTFLVSFINPEHYLDFLFQTELNLCEMLLTWLKISFLFCVLKLSKKHIYSVRINAFFWLQTFYKKTTWNKK
jgi:hypothetical protein